MAELGACDAKCIVAPQEAGLIKLLDTGHVTCRQVLSERFTYGSYLHVNFMTVLQMGN